MGIGITIVLFVNLKHQLNIPGLKLSQLCTGTESSSTCSNDTYLFQRVTVDVWLPWL